MNRLFWGAALAGGLYWASKQEGGIQGVAGRFGDKLKQVQDSGNPLETLKSQFTGPQIEPASTYTPLPEHTPAG
jgi:hypothetical protein